MNHHNPSTPVILAIAGFDPSGGAGIVADLKTFHAHLCYGVAAITALTVQNTQGVQSAHAVDAGALRETIRALLADGHVSVIKTGMLMNRANVQVVGEILGENPDLPVVIDPVIRSSSGKELLDAPGVEALKSELLARATVITPNLAEAAILAGMRVENVEEMKAAARQLISMGARAVVVTGGHLEKPADVLAEGNACEVFSGDRIKPDSTHGTGCTFASALAANLALGRTLTDSVVLAKAYVTEAIRKAYAIGPGQWPLNHLYRMQQQPRLADHASAVAEVAH